MAQHNDFGKLGEQLAQQHLVRQGFAIMETNYRVGKLEADIIAYREGLLAFVEVKTRGENAIEQAPREAVTREKQEKIKKAAASYLQHNKTKLQPRFDVIEIVTGENDPPLSAKRIEHLKNAFETGDLHAAF